MSMTIKQCAEIVSLSTATLKRYVKKGMPINDDGTFEIADVALWIADNGSASHLTKPTEPQKRAKIVKEVKAKIIPINKKNEEVPPEDSDLPMSFQEAKTRGEIAKALLAELTLAKELEQVANIDDLMGEFSDALVNVRASLSSMSSRLAGILAHQDEHEIRKLIDAEVETMLTGLCKYDG